MLLDWVAQIKIGLATLRVHFTGGALTVYGITPAEYTTSDPFIQKAIEMSSYFKDGRIKELRRVATESNSVKKEEGTAIKTEPVIGNKAKASETKGIRQIAVSCLQEAQAYLQENYNISSHKVRTPESAAQAAKEHGINFVGVDFGGE